MEVKYLLKSKNIGQKDYVLQSSILMNGLIFSKLYQYLSNFNNYTRIAFYSETFSQLCNDIVIASRLALDAFIEYETLGKDWETLFLKMTNEMVEDVIYNPEEIDYSVTPASQEMFVKNISAPVYAEIEATIRQLNSMY